MSQNEIAFLSRMTLAHGRAHLEQAVRQHRPFIRFESYPASWCIAARAVCLGHVDPEGVESGGPVQKLFQWCACDNGIVNAEQNGLPQLARPGPETARRSLVEVEGEFP